MAAMQEAGKRWYLVYTKPRQERVAQEHLGRQGYEVYLPRVRQVRRRGGRRVATVEAMFPRYLFVWLDSNTDNWSPIRSTRGVVSIVRFGQEPGRVPDEFIGYLRGREDTQGLQTIPANEPKPGTRVRVTAGSFIGFEGVYHARSGRERVFVLLEIMGKVARTAIDRDSFEIVGRS